MYVSRQAIKKDKEYILHKMKHNHFWDDDWRREGAQKQDCWYDGKDSNPGLQRVVMTINQGDIRLKRS